MKRTKLLSAFLVLFTAIGFISCDVEPIDPVLLDYEAPEVLPASFKVDFSGQTYTATTTEAVIADGLIAIGGIRGTNGETVGFSVVGTTTGTYSGANLIMSYEPSAISEYTYNNFNPANEETSGTVTISSIDTVNHTISGTFSFTGWWGDAEANLPSVAFTNGVFTNLPYTTSATPTPGEDDEYFKATIDGTAKDYSIISGLTAGTTLNLTGTDAATMSFMNIMVDTDITPGIYTMAESPFDGPTASYQVGEIGYFTTTGTITIISNENGFIKGTFSFNGADIDGINTIVVTAGSFNVGY
ncbi:DUF6252 family protein [Flavobacterium subsaxonicum]|uniref:Transferrin-binding protein B C-lobe/N-lobe beta barrel domain-containing protein n=1 Tax=Flavobacterium subsaxonicum WB 4.1-42 = DSM 21790 TaxID=1121898 RepID=A0A0A2MGV2_9FLAO|nr:DUF6252 family protein [Flavobacterium subsaxonicum]KGO91902.1 hypothetical protein Q766_15795 [Flavobacterium subsaxonicum WB 4.1-42 = DSM 21790]